MSKSILLLSDNHSYYHDELLPFIDKVDEIWHAGDIGNLDSIAKFKNKVLRCVYGNIDDANTRLEFPESLVFICEGIKVLMIHIGGYPGAYTKKALEGIISHKPNLFISGHSHICKIMPDNKYNLIHMNPGAYGHHGFHLMRTMISFSINQGKLENIEVIELGRRGRPIK